MCRRNDRVDLVEDLVGEGDLCAGEQVVELLHGAWPDDCAGHAGVSDRERDREVGHRHAGLLGERDELLDGVESMFVLEARHHGRATRVGLLVLAVRPVSMSLASGAQTSVPIP